MSHWNYRVVLKDGVYAVHEVYYDDDGQPELVTRDAVVPMGKSLDELMEDVAQYVLALSKPVLNHEDFRPS